MRMSRHYKITLAFVAVVAVVLAVVYSFLANRLREYTLGRITQDLTRQALLARSFLAEEAGAGYAPSRL